MGKVFICSKCGLEKEYHSKDMCKKCYHFNYSKQHYQKNKKKYAENEKQWRLNNPEKGKEYQKLWWKKNPDYQKLWRLNNLEKARNLNKKYYQKNKNKNKEKMKKYHKIDYQKNKEKYKLDAKKWRENNRERDKELHRKYYQNNKEKHKLRVKKWQEKNPTFFKKWQQNKLKTDINFKIGLNLSSLIRNTLKSQGVKKSKKSEKYLGCTKLECIKYLNKTGPKGVTVKDIAQYKYHIDHIIPLSSFNLSKESEQLKAFNYKNLQLLWWEDNLKKGSKILETGEI